jgi:hypothetical protein
MLCDKIKKNIFSSISCSVAVVAIVDAVEASAAVVASFRQSCALLELVACEQSTAMT